MKNKKVKNKNRLKKIYEKLLFGIFMENLPDFLEIWQRRDPELSFDEFWEKGIRSEVPEEWSNRKKFFYRSFFGVVLKVIEIWRESESNLPFEEYLKGVAERHEQIISKKSKKEVAQ